MTDLILMLIALVLVIFSVSLYYKVKIKSNTWVNIKTEREVLYLEYGKFGDLDMVVYQDLDNGGVCIETKKRFLELYRPLTEKNL